MWGAGGYITSMKTQETIIVICLIIYAILLASAYL